MSEYPEHDKLVAVRDESQAIGEFLDWLESEGYVIARHRCPHGAEPAEDCEESRYCRRGENETVLWAEPFGDRWITARLAEHFGIDQAKIEAEKDAMLDAMRAATR